MTARRIIFTLFSIVCLFSGGSAVGDLPASLRTQIFVDGDTVKLGDVFIGAGAHADKVIARAPAPGRRLVMEAAWLYRVARAYKVPWRPASRLDQAIVERRSHVIEAAEISNVIATALADREKIDSEVEIEFDNPALRFYLPTNVSPQLAVRSISFDPRSRRFFANLVTPGDSTDSYRFSVSGNAHKLVRVPTFTRRLYTDDIIGTRDIDWKSMRVNRLDPRTVLDASKLTGMSPRRPILADRAILTTDIEPPTLVRRGKQVTILLQTPNMALTALGKSLQDGAKGDIVRVQNIDSGNTIETVVIGPERVTATVGAALPLN